MRSGKALPQACAVPGRWYDLFGTGCWRRAVVARPGPHLMHSPRVIVTRPAGEASRWVASLRTAGLDAVALPLIVVEPVSDVSRLLAIWQHRHTYDAIMFVSGAAVEYFFKQKEVLAPSTRAQAASHPIAEPRFWAPGPGTAQALQRAGVDARAIDQPAAHAASFDSEALWADVHAQVAPGTRILIVRGSDAAGRSAGRDWLTQQIRAVGGRCDVVVAYQRRAPQWGEAEQELAEQGATGAAVWLFSSSEAIANLCHAMPGFEWKAARAVATHARIAQAAREAGFGTVQIASPTPSALVASIELIA